MRHPFCHSGLIFTSITSLLLLACSSTPTQVVVPKAGPNITEIEQVDLFPIGQIEDESIVLTHSDNQIEFPKAQIKVREQVFDANIEITWVQNGSGIDLLKVNQSLNDTWHLLNEALVLTDYDVELVNEQFGQVLVVLPDGIEFIDTSDDSFLISKGKTEDRFKIEFRVDAVDDGTIISLQFEDDLLLPADDNLIHLDNVRELMSNMEIKPNT